MFLKLFDSNGKPYLINTSSIVSITSEFDQDNIKNGYNSRIYFNSIATEFGGQQITVIETIDELYEKINRIKWDKEIREVING